MWTPMFLLLTCTFVFGYAFDITNVHKGYECPEGTRCLPLHLCSAPAQIPRASSSRRCSETIFSESVCCKAAVEPVSHTGRRFQITKTYNAKTNTTLYPKHSLPLNITSGKISPWSPSSQTVKPNATFVRNITANSKNITNIRNRLERYPTKVANGGNTNSTYKNTTKNFQRPFSKQTLSPICTGSYSKNTLTRNNTSTPRNTSHILFKHDFKNTTSSRNLPTHTYSYNTFPNNGMTSHAMKMPNNTTSNRNAVGNFDAKPFQQFIRISNASTNATYFPTYISKLNGPSGLTNTTQHFFKDTSNSNFTFGRISTNRLNTYHTNTVDKSRLNVRKSPNKWESNRTILPKSTSKFNFESVSKLNVSDKARSYPKQAPMLNFTSQFLIQHAEKSNAPTPSLHSNKRNNTIYTLRTFSTKLNNNTESNRTAASRPSSTTFFHSFPKVNATVIHHNNTLFPPKSNKQTNGTFSNIFPNLFSKNSPNLEANSTSRMKFSQQRFARNLRYPNITYLSRSFPKFSNNTTTQHVLRTKIIPSMIASSPTFRIGQKSFNSTSHIFQVYSPNTIKKTNQNGNTTNKYKAPYGNATAPSYGWRY